MSVHDFQVQSIGKDNVSLAAYRGKVMLIVNTASKCGFTGQYQGLQDLYDKYSEQGLEILAFPCNQFGGQEPGSNDEIQQFCATRFSVSFPIFDKIDVNGPKADPLYEYLKKECKGVLGSEAIKWNFTKFLVDRDGKPGKRYAPKTKPAELEGDIQAMLANGTAFSSGQAADKQAPTP